MSQELVRISEKSIIPYLQPKQQDLINMIGQVQLKKELSFAIQAAQSNSLLIQAPPASIAKCVWNIAITGLTLNPIHKLAYITPRKDSNGNWDAILMPSYQGLVKLITDTGSVKNIFAHVVYKGDDFEVTYGTEMGIKHTPKFKTIKNEDLTHVYAVAILDNGTKQIEVMGLEEIHAIRARSDGYRAFANNRAKSAIWETDFAEMSRKTVIKRITKYLPKGDVNKWEKVNNAIEADNAQYPATDGQRGYIETLLQTSGYNDEQRKQIYDGEDISMADAERIISDLKENQLNPITAGMSASAKEINAAVNDKLTS